MCCPNGFFFLTPLQGSPCAPLLGLCPEGAQGQTLGQSPGVDVDLWTLALKGREPFFVAGNDLGKTPLEPGTWNLQQSLITSQPVSLVSWSAQSPDHKGKRIGCELTQVIAIHDGVQHAVLQQELASLKALGKLLADCLFDDTRTSKAD